jgi:putative thiamine transport system ATP-binding protein
MSLVLRLDRLSSPRGTLLQSVYLEVQAGQVLTLMGPSGCGKSSLLAAVCGTLAAGMEFAGSVLLHGQRIDTLPTQARRVGLLLQDDLLFAHLTVRENLLFALPVGARRERDAAVQQALTDVEMHGFGDADPATLSGGQRARVALARALLARPQALLLDEPFSRLDADLRGRMRALVFGLVAQRGIAALLVTHDRADVADPDRLCVLGGSSDWNPNGTDLKPSDPSPTGTR